MLIFPGGPVTKNVPAKAGDTDLIPELGDATGQLNQWAATIEHAL